MLLIQAMNVHQGGGLALLIPILESAASEQPVIALLDKRLEGTRTLPKNLQVRWVAPSIKARVSAERWLRIKVAPDDLVLCFGNLPPIWRLSCQVVLFVQNRLLIDDVTLRDFHWKTRLRLLIERQWLKRAALHADRFVVQTPSMQRLLCDALRLPQSKVSVNAFVNAPSSWNGDTSSSRVSPLREHAEFLYPASGDPHKNHRLLVEAWAVLRTWDSRPVLHLTVDPAIYPDLVKWIDAERERADLAVINHGQMPFDQLTALYAKMSALIFPSLLESFGLPLLEARQAGLPVIAAELDYIRDVVQPVQSFDPRSAVSIARAVQRFLTQAPDVVNLVSADEFMHAVRTGGPVSRLPEVSAAAAAAAPAPTQ